MKKISRPLCLVLLGLLYTTQGYSELLLEAQPPKQQVQQPEANALVTQASLPVVVERSTTNDDKVVVDEKMATEILSVLQGVLKDAANVVLVDAKGEKVKPPPEGYARNVATEAVKPRYTVKVHIGGLENGLLKGSYTPVKLVIADGTGKVNGEEEFQYVQASSKEFQEKARVFLSKQLNMYEKKAVVPKVPQLQSWLETEDGSTPVVGSKVALYYLPSDDGYVTVFHFGSAGTVQQVYPTAKEPYNFVQAGQTYRFPGKGNLTLQGPAGDETFKVVFTRYPSNTPKAQEGNMGFKGDPLHVIPTHYPVIFATGDMMRFFALPNHLYVESHIKYHLSNTKE